MAAPPSETPVAPAKAAARARGRPGAEAPELRPRLLDAALDCYAARGIAAATLRDIARVAGVTPALLHYYFGDRDQLLQAVVQERVLPAIAPVREAVAMAGGERVGALVAAFVDAMAATIVRHPWLPPLWVREVVSEGGALRSLLAGQVGGPVASVLAARFARAQACGELNPALDPRLLVVSLVGLTLFPAAGAPIWRQLFEADDLGVDDLRRHALALLEGGMRAESRR